MTRSMASSNSGHADDLLSRRAARIAASLTRLARSAPREAWRLAGDRPPGRAPWSQRLAAGVHLEDLLAALDVRRGRAPRCRSKRPGRSSAGSRTSGRLVAAITMTPAFVSKPSISTRIWLRVCSRSSCPPPMPAPRWRPTASISSMKMMHGAVASWPVSKRSRTRLAPTPTNISTKSEPEMREERHAGLAGDGAGQQGLAGAGRADQQHALGDPGAESVKLLGVLQELDDLAKLVLGLVDAGHVARR